MGITTATIEMQSPEEHRERLHDLLRATHTVLVLGWGRAGDAPIGGRRMRLLHTDDDTTMHVEARLDAEELAALTRQSRVAVAVHGSCLALFDAEASISRSSDGTLLDGKTT